MENKMKNAHKVTKPQLVAVTILTLFILAAGIVIAALYGNFSMSSGNKQLLGANIFSTDTSGLPMAKQSETVSLKNGDTYTLAAGIVQKEFNGKKVKMLAYNGSVPGPLIKVQKGSEVTIHLVNNTDVETTLHSHGVRGENRFDGVPDVTQKAIPVGGTFTYKLTFPDEGMFWYHPHIREDYTQESGLYGNYLVVPTDTSYWSPVNQELPLVLDDILLENGKLAAFSKNNVDHTLMGRFGNTMLVNGDTNYEKTVNAGDVIRFYLTNAANTRIFNVSIPNAKMKLVGGDNGRVEKEQFVESVTLSPSERSIVEVFFDKPGVYKVEHKTPEKTYTLGTITVSDTKADKNYQQEFTTLRENPLIASSISSLEQYMEKPADKGLTMSVTMKNQSGGMDMNNGMQMDHGNMNMGDNSMQIGANDTDKIEWEDTNMQMNQMSNKDSVSWKLIDDTDKKENMDINWQFKKGDVVKIKLFNDPNAAHPMQHPIHIHGQRFLVLSTNGVKNDNFVFKDSVLVQKGDTVELLVQMDNPGKWIIHCHIPEHMEAGMMSKFQVN